MVVGGLLAAFALIVCILGGNNADVTQLYYDADFVELYDTESDDGTSGEREFKGGQRIKQEEKEEPPLELSDNELPGDTVAVDNQQLSQEIYESVDM